MNCPTCGASLNPNARFCPNCGNAVPPPVEDPADAGQGFAASVPPGATAPPPADGQITDAGSFVGALFDLSFATFITTRIIKVLYILSIVAIGLGAIGLFFSFATQGGAAAVAGLILAPLFFLLYVIFARVWLEIIIVIFRIAEYTGEIARNSRR